MFGRLGGKELYFAFPELGRVVRTMFLLRYVAEVELRRTILAATNKSGRFNEFVQWISFGTDNLIAENVRDEQRKSSSTTTWWRTSWPSTMSFR